MRHTRYQSVRTEIIGRLLMKMLFMWYEFRKDGDIQ